MNKIEETIREYIGEGTATVAELTDACSRAGACSSRATVKRYLDQMTDVEAIPGWPVHYYLKGADAAPDRKVRRKVSDVGAPFSDPAWFTKLSLAGKACVFLERVRDKEETAKLAAMFEMTPDAFLNAIRDDERFVADEELVTLVDPDWRDKEPASDPEPQPDKTVFEPIQSDCLDHIFDTIRRMADENMMLKRQLQAVREALV